VSTPLHWHEVPVCDPADFTVLTVPKRFAEFGDPHLGIDAEPGSLEKLLELAAEDEAAGFGDAPWPPHFRKMEGEGPRVQPSRARSAVKKPSMKKPRTRAPLLVVANSPDREAAVAGLERWKSKHPEVAALLAVDDVLIDSMRGRSSTWTRIRVNLRNVPEGLRPPQETLTQMTIRRVNGADKGSSRSNSSNRSTPSHLLPRARGRKGARKTV
jgi:hypothetical protein